MAELSITEAINLSPIARTRFYSHYIKKGLITVSVNANGDKYIDSAELFRVFGDIKDKSPEPIQETSELNAPAQQTNEVIQLLREQLEKAEEREKEHLSHIKTLNNRLEHAEKPTQTEDVKLLTEKLDAITKKLEQPAQTEQPKKRQSKLAKWWYATDED